jgi:hypothetical protein
MLQLMLLSYTHAHHLYLRYHYQQKDSDTLQGRPVITVINSIKSAISSSSSSWNTAHTYNMVDRLTTDTFRSQFQSAGPGSAPLPSVCAVFDNLSLAHSAANVARLEYAVILCCVALPSHLALRKPIHFIIFSHTTSHLIIFCSFFQFSLSLSSCHFFSPLVCALLAYM